MDNSIIAIFPYKYNNIWVFDDPDVDLVKEPFVCGVPEMIEDLVKDIPQADKKFKLLFSKTSFPGYQIILKWLRSEYNGHWYTSNDNNEGWLCPALFKYFDKAPKSIYVKAEKYE